jgi:hypothetical protein
VIEFGKVASEIFKVLQTYDYDVYMFDASGNKVIEPSEARRFFSKNKDIAIDIIEDAENSVIKFIKSESVMMSEVLGFSDALKNLANEIYMMTYVIEGHEGPIIPKDFSKPLSEDRKEDMDLIENMYGTTRSSYLKLGKARLIVKHSNKVDEAVAGSRSRRIDRMYVENSQGERHLLPGKYLSVGRAMAQHVNQGHPLDDDNGKKLAEAAQDYHNLAIASNHIRKHRASLTEEADELREKIRHGRSKLRKTFEKVYKNYDTGMSELNETPLYEEEAMNEERKRAQTVMNSHDNIADELGHGIFESVARHTMSCGTEPTEVDEAKTDLVSMLDTQVDRAAFIRFADDKLDDHGIDLKCAPKIGEVDVKNVSALSRAVSKISQCCADDSMTNFFANVSELILEPNPPKLAMSSAKRLIKLAHAEMADSKMKNPVLAEHLSWLKSFNVDNIFLGESMDEESDECEGKDKDCDDKLSKEDVLLPKSKTADLRREVVKPTTKDSQASEPALLFDDEMIDEDEISEAKRKSMISQKASDKDKKCGACNGSGYYDTSIKGKTPKCASCNGTGMKKEKD